MEASDWPREGMNRPIAAASQSVPSPLTWFVSDRLFYDDDDDDDWDYCGKLKLTPPSLSLFSLAWLFALSVSAVLRRIWPLIILQLGPMLLVILPATKIILKKVSAQPPDCKFQLLNGIVKALPVGDVGLRLQPSCFVVLATNGVCQVWQRFQFDPLLNVSPSLPGRPWSSSWKPLLFLQPGSVSLIIVEADQFD